MAGKKKQKYLWQMTSRGVYKVPSPTGSFLATIPSNFSFDSSSHNSCINLKLMDSLFQLPHKKGWAQIKLPAATNMRCIPGISQKTSNWSFKKFLLYIFPIISSIILAYYGLNLVLSLSWQYISLKTSESDKMHSDSHLQKDALEYFSVTS